MFYDRLDPMQKFGVDELLKLKALGCFFEQGVGKTWFALGCIEALLNLHPNFRGLLVVPLSSIVNTWEKNLQTHLPQLRLCRHFEDYKAAPEPKVLLLHYEAFVRLIDRIHKVPFTFGLFDESHRLKARGTGQSRAARRLKNVEYRTILSGTPLESDQLDLWGQFAFLKPELLGTWADFKSNWLVETGYMGYKVKMRKNLITKFMELITPYCIRAELAEVMGDVEKPEFHIEKVKMIGRQLEVYRNIELDYFDANLGITADLEITQIAKLMQITGGFVKDDEGQVIELNSTKLARVRSIVSKIDRPFIVFCKYSAEREALVVTLQNMGLNVAELHGKIKDRKVKKRRSDIIEAFQEGKYDGLVCQVKIGSESLNLQVSTNSILYSTGYSSIDFFQMVHRIYRRGQNKKTHIWVILAEDSIDIPIYEAISLKQDVIKAVTSYIRKRRSPTMAKKLTPPNVAPRASAKSEPTEAAEATTKKAKDSAEKEPKAPEFKYGVKDLAELLGIDGASVRVKLRNKGIEKAGRSYGWNTKTDLEAVVKQLQAKKEKAEKAE